MMLMRGVERYIEANDRNEVARRAFVLVLALREWQLRHGGQFPKSLDALVPEQLTSLPLDPYSGQPFGYARSQGQEVPSLRYVLALPQVRDIIPRPGVGFSTVSALTVAMMAGSRSRRMTVECNPCNPWTSFLKSLRWKVRLFRAKGKIMHEVRDTSEIRIRQRIAPRLLARRQLIAHVFE